MNGEIEVNKDNRSESSPGIKAAIEEPHSEEDEKCDVEIQGFNVTPKQRKSSVVHKFPGLGINIIVIPSTPRPSPLPWENIEKPKLKRKPDDLEVLENENAEFEFELENSEGITLRWCKDGKPLLEGGKIKTHREENIIRLEIQNAEVEDEALYECYVSNEAGEIRCEMQLLVEEPEEQESPRFLKALSLETDVIEGKALALKVEVSGVPTPEVKWYFDGRLVESTDYMSLSKKGNVHQLTINETEFDDEGLYECVAENECGKVETRTEVFVEESKVKQSEGLPNIISGLDDIDAYIGETVNFVIESTGDLSPNAKWYINGRMVIDSPRIKILTDKARGLHSLIINPVSAKDKGEVKCILINEAGSITETCELSVT